MNSLQSGAEFPNLIPELQNCIFGGKRGIDIQDWIRGVGCYEHAIGYSQFFWPEFVEHDGCVLLTPLDVEYYNGWAKKTNDDKRVIETEMNNIYLDELFVNGSRVPTRAQVCYVGRVIKEMWEAKLKRDFPKHRFTVSLRENEEYVDNIMVTFFQVRGEEVVPTVPSPRPAPGSDAPKKDGDDATGGKKP